MGKGRKGKIPWNKGLTKETDKRVRGISDSLKDRYFSEETKKKMSENAKKRTGVQNPMSGKHHTEATKKKISL